MLIQR